MVNRPQSHVIRRLTGAAGWIVLILPMVLALPVPARAQDPDWSKVEIRTTTLAPGIYMMAGAGGNLGVCAGPDGVFLIDDQFAPLTDKIRTAIAAVSDQPVRFVLNTHLHDDHTGGNENLGRSGSLIVAHENVRRRMSVTQFEKTFNDTIPASPKAALPVVTFTESVTFHLNGEEIEVFHVAPAHTDGDAIIRFRNVNVIHMGDCLFNGLYPFIDADAGGNIDGMVVAADRILPLIDDRTKLIPGHGPLAGKAELQAFREMLAGVSAAIHPLIDRGMTRDEVIAARPTARWDERWGGGFLKPDQFTGMVYDGLKK